MTTVIITSNSISLKGHAGYAAKGSDVVCAAVSALSQTLVMAAEILTKDDVEYAINSGNLEFGWEEASETLKTLIDGFRIGIMAIAADYPECITLVDGV